MRLNTFPQPRFVLCGQTHPLRGPVGCAGSILAEGWPGLRESGLPLTAQTCCSVADWTGGQGER